MEVAVLVPVVVFDHVVPSSLPITSAEVVAPPIMSEVTNVNVGLNEVNPATPVLLTVHLRSTYFVWLKPEANGGCEATVETSRYPHAETEPAKATETGV